MRFWLSSLLIVATMLARTPAMAADDPIAEATSLDQQATVLYQQGRYAEAEPLYQRALAIREKILGPDNADVAASLNNLAALYQAQGRYAEAEPLAKRTLAIDEKVLGPDRADVAIDLNNLAVIYWAEGRYADAEPSYQRALAIYQKTLGQDHPDVAKGLSNLALLYLAQGRLAEAEPLLTRALAILEKALGPDDPGIADSLNDLAELDRDQGRYAEAEPLYKRALAIDEKALGPDHPAVAQTLNNLAALYWQQGRYDDAEPPYKRAMAIWEKTLGPDHPNVAQSLNNLGELYRDEGRYAEAEAPFKRALAIKEKALGPDHPDVALSLNNLATLYKTEGRSAEAEPLFKRALAIREKALGAGHPDVAQSLNNLAALYQDEDRPAEAEPLYQRALAIREKALGADHPAVAENLNNLASLHNAQHRYGEALQESSRAVAILAKHLSIRSVQRSGTTDAERRADRIYFTNYLQIADGAAGDDPERRAAAAAETFRVAQLARASSAAAAVAGMTARFAAGGDALAEVVRERQDLGARWQVLDADIVKAASRPSAERKPAEEAASRAALDETEHRLDALDQRIATEFPDYAELSNPQPVPAEAAQALLAGDEALLVYLATTEETWLWVLRRGDTAFYRLAINAAELAHQVTVLRGALDPQLNPDLVAFPAADAYELYQKILAPAASELSGIRRLLIVPDGALESLPLTVLLTELPEHAPENAADHRALAWLVREYATTVLPSVSSLRALRQLPKLAAGSAPFLGIGDPLLGGLLPPLPDTENELRAVATTLGAADGDLLLGARASEAALRQMPLDRYRIIEFATHGLVAGDLPGLAEPALALTPPTIKTPDDDGLLTASKIATLKLNADWVVLSACNTAANDSTSDAGGLSGLAKAFFYAGARSLLVSHWEVPSQAAVALTTGAFAALAEDPAIGRAEALRRAEMAMLDPKKPAEFAHPMFWAPFVLAGEGGAAR